MKVFVSAGEPSGDLHAAKLLRQLRRRARVECAGFGGPHLTAAGCEVLYPLTDLAVMWFLQAGLNLHRFAELVARADRYMRRQRPDAVVLVDFPGFNWWIARRAHAQGIPVFYYVPPQIWAWAPWRVRKMRRYVDHVLCSLPFEKDWYEARGVQAAYVGHPFFDEVAGRRVDDAFVRSMSGLGEAGDGVEWSSGRGGQRERRRGPLVALLPGSRRKEVVENFGMMLAAARRLHEKLPGVRFVVACFKEEHREIIRACDACLAVSGSVSLELLCEAKPTVIVYKVSRLALRLSRWLLHVPYITLVNLLAGEALFPEFLTDGDESAGISEQLYGWLTDPERYGELVARLVELRARVAQPGASSRAADSIVTAVTRGHVLPMPHFRRARMGAGLPGR
jgi:lipid-A-disaccharide synthase